MEKTVFTLRPGAFCERPYEIGRCGGIEATAFKYTTGVCGLRLKTKRAELEILPFNGQQVWRACFDGRDFTMKSTFDEPLMTDDFELSYGAFMIHCGLTAMGNPSEEDPHPMHGELPRAHYDEATLEFGSDEKGNYVQLSGKVRYRNALETDYVAGPRLRLYENETRVHMCFDIENRRSTDMFFMYMCHINWRPFDGARLLYSAPNDADHFDTFYEDFGQTPQREKARYDYYKKLSADHSVGDVIDPDNQCYDPELCCCIKYKTDERGWAHAMQLLPEGDGCYVGFDTTYLPTGVRWMARTGEEASCGFALPNTGNHLGRAYAIEHGLRKTVPPKSSVSLFFEAGYLDKNESAAMSKTIAEIAAK